MTTPITTLTLVAEAATSPSATSWDVPFTTLVPPDSALVFAYGAGAAHAYLTSISDDLGNPWQIAGQAPGGRVSAIGLCERTVREIRPGDLLHLTATSQMNSGRIQIWSLPRAATMAGDPLTATSDETPGTAVRLEVPADPGEYIFAVHSCQSAYTMADNTWPILRQHPTTAPIVRSFWQPATLVPEVFTATLSAVGGWTMTAIRLRAEGWSPPLPPEPPPDPNAGLVPVRWNGTNLNPGYRDDGLLAIVTDVEGWYGTPPLDGHNLDRALADGAILGPKVIRPRVVVISGAATGPRDACLAFARELAGLAALKAPADLVIAEDGHELVASVRADSDQMTHEWAGPVLFRYSVPATAVDPRLYEADWQSVTVSLAGGEATGRHYARTYEWTYGAASLPNSARIVNPGNAETFVWARWEGPLGESRLTDGVNTIIMAPLLDGQAILVDTETLTATAPGGATRASFILAGSRPLLVPPYSSPTWRLYGTGTGSIGLMWRGAWT